jgi:hypothetical protein
MHTTFLGGRQWSTSWNYILLRFNILIFNIVLNYTFKFNYEEKKSRQYYVKDDISVRKK